MRILVVEDDPAVSHSLALMLRSETCSIHTTDLGEEGVDLGSSKSRLLTYLGHKEASCVSPACTGPSTSTLL